MRWATLLGLIVVGTGILVSILAGLAPLSGEPSMLHASLSPQPLRVLVVGGPIAVMHVEAGFRQNVPSPVVENLQFVPSATELPFVMTMYTALQEDIYDLVVFPRGFLADPQFFDLFGSGFGGQVNLLTDLSEQLPILIDEGFVYLPLAMPGSAFGMGPVIGVELPWDSSYAISIPSSTQHFEEALRVLQSLSSNVLPFFLTEQQVRVYVKTNRFQNHSNRFAYDMHLEYSMPVEDADPDRTTWKCEVSASDRRKVECQTNEDDPIEPWNPDLQAGGRISVGVAFIGEEGAWQRCWWTAADGTPIYIDGALRC